MAVYTTTVAVGKWANRKNLTYVPVNNRINGKTYNAFGVASDRSIDPVQTRRPYKIEEDGNTSYVMYDDDSAADVAIYRTVEE